MDENELYQAIGPANVDFAFNGQASGNVAATLLRNDFDPDSLRVWFGKDGRNYRMMRNAASGKKNVILANSPVQQGLLTRQEWIEYDRGIHTVQKNRLRIVADLVGGGLVYNLADPLGTPVLSWERESDVTPADMSMDGMRRTQGDRPLGDINNTPVPIIHKDFDISARQLRASRKGNQPIDTRMARLCTRRCAELAEQLHIGTYGSYSFGGGTIYGLMNFPQRHTGSITSPTAGGWTPSTTEDEILGIINTLQLDNNFGPYMVYYGLPWDPYMNKDYINAPVGATNVRVGNVITLRDRIKMNANILDVRLLDNMPTNTYDLIVVQWDDMVFRTVQGMKFTMVSWSSDGGFGLHFKILGVMFPQAFADMNNQCGIAHYKP
jgi:uncharacterized linocin/CFP29 family protein